MLQGLPPILLGRLAFHSNDQSKTMKAKITIIFLSTAASLSFAAGPRYSDWSEPVNVGPLINTAFNDQHAAISKDGLSLYFTSNRPGGFGADDLWVSRRASAEDAWGAPQNLGSIINTAAVEFAPALSRDGHLLFFHTDRPGGFGGADIWASYREHTDDDFDWQPAVNLGSGVNSIYDDAGPTYFEDDDTGITTLYFTSLNRPEGLGDWDVYSSVLGADGVFGAATLGVELGVRGGNGGGRAQRAARPKDRARHAHGPAPRWPRDDLHLEPSGGNRQRRFVDFNPRKHAGCVVHAGHRRPFREHHLF